MPGNCDALSDWLNLEVNRLQAAQGALESATANATQALAYQAAAETWVASCNYFILDLPVYAICEVPAVAAVAAAAYAVNYYQGKAEEAQAAYNEIQQAINTLESLLDRCVMAQNDNLDDEVNDVLAYAETIATQAENIQIPIVDSAPLEEAQQKVAEAEAAVQQAQQAANDATGNV